MQYRDLKYIKGTIEGDDLQDINVNIRGQLEFWNRMEMLSDEYFL